MTTPPEQIRRELVQRIRSTPRGRITRVSFDQWLVTIQIDQINLVIEGSWAYLDPEDEILDNSIELENRTHFELWRAIGEDVIDFDVQEDEFDNLVLTLSDGHQIIAYGDDDDYEDWDLGGIVCMRRL